MTPPFLIAGITPFLAAANILTTREVWGWTAAKEWQC